MNKIKAIFDGSDLEFGNINVEPETDYKLQDALERFMKVHEENMKLLFKDHYLEEESKQEERKETEPDSVDSDDEMKEEDFEDDDDDEDDDDGFLHLNVTKKKSAGPRRSSVMP